MPTRAGPQHKAFCRERPSSGGTLVVNGPISGAAALIAHGTLDLEGIGNVINSKIIGPGLIEFGGGSTTIDPGTSGTDVTEIELAGARP